MDNSNGNTAAGQAPSNYRPQNIQGKTAVVGGGTTGIGRAIARLLVERGARVLIFGRNEDDLKETVAELQTLGEAYGVSGDQSKIEDVQRIFAEADAKLGSVDILVNSAAVFAGTILEESAEDIAYGVNTNLTGYLICSQEAIKRMEKNPNKGEDKVEVKGHIINIGSLSAEAREEESDVYVATKAAIQAFSASLRKSANPRGIKVSLVEPGLVWSDLIAENYSPEEGKEKQLNGEMLQEEDIAEAVHYALTQPARCDVIVLQVRPHNQPL